MSGMTVWASALPSTCTRMGTCFGREGSDLGTRQGAGGVHRACHRGRCQRQHQCVPALVIAKAGVDNSGSMSALGVEAAHWLQAERRLQAE
eukprot:837273-Rhodomonas_salina.2